MNKHKVYPLDIRDDTGLCLRCGKVHTGIVQSLQDEGRACECGGKRTVRSMVYVYDNGLAKFTGGAEIEVSSLVYAELYAAGLDRKVV